MLEFGWVGATCMLHNEFCWSNELIIWKDLLLFLGVETVKLPAPKNFFGKDVYIKSEISIFATNVITR